MNIRVDLNTPIKDGTEVVFRSPVDCSQITGLIVYYNGESTEFALADAHGNNVGDIDHLFAEDVVIKVILDLSKSMAFVQNADTNAYLEQRIDGVDLTLPQNLTPEKKAQVLSNIGAAAVGGGDGGTGLTDTARALLITILRNGVFTSDQSANITALETALAGGGEDEPDEPVVPDIPDEPDAPDVPDEPDVPDIHDGYIADGLEFRLDGIRNSKDGHVDGANFTDVSGNDHAFNTNTAGVTYNADHIYADNRNTIRVTDFATLLAKLSNYTIEVVWKAENAIPATVNNSLVAVGDNVANYPLLATGQMVAVGANTRYGSTVSGETQINHYTITYDGTTQKLYHEGLFDAEVISTINITTGNKLNFFGNDDWSQHTAGSQYAVRVYNRALTADEVKANYDNDIARFGTGVA